jgi:hypothetical protein
MVILKELPGSRIEVTIDNDVYQVDTLCQKNPYLFALKEVSDRLWFDYGSSKFWCNK